MAHANGRIYIDTNTTTHGGIELDDMRSVFGVGGANMGAIVQNAIARDLINQWAIAKAERSDKLGILTLADRQENYFGLDIAFWKHGDSPSDFVSSYSAGWVYLPPRGKATSGSHVNNEWFRWRDFNGYNHNANCFINPNDSNFPTEYTVGQGNTGAAFRLGINTGPNLHQDSIGIGTALNPDGLRLYYNNDGGTAFGALYFGLLFVTGSTYMLITSQTALNTDGFGSELTIPEVSGELDGIDPRTTYAVYPCLSKVVHETLSAPGSGIYAGDILVSLPMSPFSFKTKSVAEDQNISIGSPQATLYRGRGITVDFILSMSAQGGAATSMTANWVVYAADYIGDTSGSQIASYASGTPGPFNISTTQPGNVHKDIITTPPSFVRIYAYNANAQTVSAEAYAQVSETPIE